MQSLVFPIYFFQKLFIEGKTFWGSARTLPPLPLGKGTANVKFKTEVLNPMSTGEGFFPP